MDTQNFNRINLSPSDNNVKKEDPTKNVNANIPYVDNTNIDLKNKYNYPILIFEF
jgi:hypothetical protein